MSDELGFEALFLGWQQFLDHLGEMEVLDAPSWRRLIDGTQLAKALDVKPGKWMAAALDVCMAWQFRNPQATDPTEAIEEVKIKAEELRIPLK
jgi:tRNA nucleotidyltransferase (CCA-adding enzyme)